MQCTKEDCGVTVLGTFFLCPNIFCQVSFLAFFNYKNFRYSNCSCLMQLCEMRGVKIYDNKGNALE